MFLGIWAVGLFRFVVRVSFLLVFAVVVAGCREALSTGSADPASHAAVDRPSISVSLATTGVRSVKVEVRNAPPGQLAVISVFGGTGASRVEPTRTEVNRIDLTTCPVAIKAPAGASQWNITEGLARITDVDSMHVEAYLCRCVWAIPVHPPQTLGKRVQYGAETLEHPISIIGSELDAEQYAHMKEAIFVAVPGSESGAYLYLDRNDVHAVDSTGEDRRGQHTERGKDK
jgi:hypothetical protein